MARRLLRQALAVPVALVLSVWLASVLGVLVIGLWAVPATGYWQPAVIAAGLAGAQLALASVAGTHIKRAADPLQSAWTLAVVALSLPLLLINMPTILVTLGRITHS